jgi:hypothetical protein
MISQADLETELWAILDKVRRIPPSDRSKGQDPFHLGKGAAADMLLKLIDRVKGVRQVSDTCRTPTAAEIRHAQRTQAR